jgi:hypothetical protein
MKTALEALMNTSISSGAGGIPPNRYSTHTVLNQAKPAIGSNAFTGDAVLRAAIDREAPWAADRCEALGAIAGDEEIQELARLANRHLPELQTHDRFGNRIDWVDFHPSWHQLMSLARKHEVPNLAWRTNQKMAITPALCCLISGIKSSKELPARRVWPTPPRLASKLNPRWLSGQKKRKEQNTSSAAAKWATSRRLSSAMR